MHPLYKVETGQTTIYSCSACHALYDEINSVWYLPSEHRVYVSSSIEGQIPVLGKMLRY